MALRRFALFVFAALSVGSLIFATPASATLFGDRSPDEFQAEKDMFKLINNKRASLSRPERRLELDGQLRRDARDNSDDMAKSEQFESPFTDFRGACSAVGRRENTSPDAAVQSIFNAWLRNPSTRACILDRQGRFGAVGVARGTGFTYWVTFIGAEGQPRA